MEYWWDFWDDLNPGWKRIHYASVLVYLFVIVIMVSLGREVSRADLFAAILVFIIPVVIYFVFVITVLWIREGFNKGKN